MRLVFAVCLSLLTPLITQSQSASVSPTSIPAGGTTIASWSGFSGPVNIELWAGDSYTGTDPWDNAPNSGTLNLVTTADPVWRVRSDYRIKIILRTNTSLFVFSNYFAVNATASVSPVTIPLGGTTTASWSGFNSEVNVELWAGDVNTGVDPWDIAPGNGTLELNTGANPVWQTRPDYYIRIVLRANTSLFVYSNPFAVTATGTLAISPTDGFLSSGYHGGPFDPPDKTYIVTNTGGVTIDWSASHGQPWTSLSNTSGSLAPGTSTPITISINGNANSLNIGSYSDIVNFNNLTSGSGGTTISVDLTVTSPPSTLAVSPTDGFSSAGGQAGPFIPAAKRYTLTNTGTSSLTWTATKSQPWLDLYNPGGTLVSGTNTDVIVAINQSAGNLLVGSYTDNVTFANTTNGSVTTRSVTLEVDPPGVLAVTPSEGFTSSGVQGGPFSPPDKIYTLTNTGSSSISWSASSTWDWVSLSSTNGSLPPGGRADVTVTINGNANSFRTGFVLHNGVTFRNVTNDYGTASRSITLAISKLTIIAPSAGDELPIGRNFEITWNSSNVNFVNIDLSTDDGTSWTAIASNVSAAALSYDWPVSSSAFSSTCTVRLTDVSNPSTSASSLQFVVAYRLTRQSPSTAYERFDITRHAWRFGSNTNDLIATDQHFCWPNYWWEGNDYTHSPPAPRGYEGTVGNCGVQEAGDVCYGVSNTKSCFTVRKSDFPDWPLYERAFASQIYTYQNYSSINPRIDAVLYWNSLKHRWSGSCYGLSISLLMAFDDSARFRSLFPGIGYVTHLNDLSQNAFLRNVVNRLHQYQWGKEQLDWGAHSGSSHVNTTLTDTKTMLQTTGGVKRNDQILLLSVGIRDENGRLGWFGHAVVPYKVTRDEIDPSIEYIWIYDPNYDATDPDYAQRKITVRTNGSSGNGKWIYQSPRLPGGFWESDANIYLSPQVNLYFDPLALPQSKSMPMNTPLATTPTGFVQIYAPSACSILIQDTSNQKIEVSGDSLTDNMLNASPILCYGEKQPQIGYHLPPGEYEIIISGSFDSTASLIVRSDSSMWSVTHDDYDSLQTTRVRIWNDALTLENQNTSDDQMRLQTILYRGSAEGSVMLEKLILLQNDSLRADVLDKSKLQITNYGTGKTYDLKIESTSGDEDLAFLHRSVSLPGNSTHELIPNWDSLNEKGVKILIDSARTGTPTDSVLISNQLFKQSVAEGWNLISLPAAAFVQSVSALFPVAKSRAFYYKDGYKATDSLTPGVGYWLKFHGSQSIDLLGDRILKDTIDLPQRWSIVGSISVPIPVDKITTIPSGIEASAFFGYNGAYFQADTLQPGRGYWIKLTVPGRLILSASTIAEPSSRLKIVATSELPPAPPGEQTSTAELPGSFALEQAYPNPFNPTTVIKYELPVASSVTITAFNVLGQQLKTLVDESEEAGYKSVTWYATGLSSGVYFYELKAVSLSNSSDSFVRVRKVLLIK